MSPKLYNLISETVEQAAPGLIDPYEQKAFASMRDAWALFFDLPEGQRPMSFEGLQIHNLANVIGLGIDVGRAEELNKLARLEASLGRASAGEEITR